MHIDGDRCECCAGLHANQYGNSLYKLGNYQDSYAVYKQQSLWALELYGPGSKEYRWAMYTLANIIAFTGNVEEGCRVYMSVAELYRGLGFETCGRWGELYL